MKITSDPGRSAVGRISIAFAVLALAGCGAILTPKYRMARAEREMRAGEWQQAAFDLRMVVHKQPQNAQAWLLLTQLSLASGDANGARSALKHAVAAGAQGAEVDRLQARTWLATGEPQKLLDALAHGTVQVSEPDRTLWQARALSMTGKPEQAITLLQALLARQPHLTSAEVALAESQAAAGQFTAAFQTLTAAIAAAPNDPAPRLIEGQIESVLGQFPAAAEAMRGALKRMPAGEPLQHRISAWVGLTEAQLALGQLQPAAESLKALVKIAPQSAVTHLLQARIALAHGKLEAGIGELESLLAAVPQYVQARMMLGAALLQHGDLEQAQQQLQQVVAETPDNIQARKLLADVQLKLGEPGEAMRVLTPALGAPQLDPQVLSLLGTAAQRSNDTQALIAALERRVQQSPHDPKVIDNLASVYLALGQAPRALALLQAQPDSDFVRDRLWVQALMATRGTAAASAGVDQLLAAHPQDPDILELGASFFATQQQLARAEPLLRRALAIRPDDFEAQIALAHIEAISGQAAAGEQRLRKALDAHPDVLALRIALAEALAGQRQFAQAEQVLSAAPKADHEPAIQFALARLALAQGQLAPANAALDRAIAAQPGSEGQMVEEAGLLLLQANQDQAAVARLVRATALEPGNALYWLNAARAQLAVNQPLAARASLEKADGLQPHWLPAVSLLALIDVREGKPQAGLSRIESYLAQSPDDPQALELKGDLESRLGQSAAAVTAYAKAQHLRPSALLAVKLYQVRLAAHESNPSQSLTQWLARWPQDWQVRTVLGDYELNVAHHPDQGIAELKQAVSENPQNAVALNNLAWAMNQKGDPGARAYAERAYKLAPKLAAVNDTLGWILASRHQGAEALDYLSRAVQLDPHSPDMQYHYAYALIEAGRRAEARQVLTRLLSSSEPFDSRQAAERLLASVKS